MRGRPGTRRISTEVFFGINIASSRYSEIAKKKNKYEGHHILQLYQQRIVVKGFFLMIHNHNQSRTVVSEVITFNI